MGEQGLGRGRGLVFSEDRGPVWEDEKVLEGMVGVVTQ